MTGVRYDPSADDPRIAAALAARGRLDDALRGGDVEPALALFAPDLVVHTPLDTVSGHAEVTARFRSGRVAYEDFDTRFEFVGAQADAVIMMGEETARPTGQAPHAGQVVRRRFTDLWRDVDGGWKLALRQATIVAVD